MKITEFLHLNMSPYKDKPTFQYLPLKSLSIGTPKTVNFPFVPNGKLMVFRCPNI